MKWGIISDIHGNIEALRQVIEDIEEENVDAIYCLGDLVGYGAHPNEVIDFFKNKSIPVVMGNYDEGVGFDREDCGCAYITSADRKLGEISLAWTKKEVSEENKKFLSSLAREIRQELGHFCVLMVHGSPRKINEYLFADRPQERLQKMLTTTHADIVICGHTHVPYHRLIGNIHLINTGSVGKPKTGSPEAHYTILEYKNGLKVNQKRIAYNWDKAANDIIKVGLPEKFALQVKTGRG